MRNPISLSQEETYGVPDYLLDFLDMKNNINSTLHQAEVFARVELNSNCLEL